jgi:hypothetical protein
LAGWLVWISRQQGGVKPPQSKALRASGLVNLRDQLEGFQDIIIREFEHAVSSHLRM